MTPIDIDSLQTTNFEFDIEANRRRRAELANDVTELISISKFFLQHYSSDSPDDLPPLPRKIKHPAITKREKNQSNVNKARGKSVGRSAQTKRSTIVAIATPTHVKRKQTRINNGRVGNDDDVPPLFDKIKLHEYCVDIVDRFFHGPPPNDSEISESPKNAPPPPPPPQAATVKKSQSIEKPFHSTTNHSNEIILSKPRKNSKYASVPSRYMNQTPQKSINEPLLSKNNSQYRLVSAKSREILEEVARKGTEIKRHSCLIHKREKSILNPEYGSTQQDCNRSQIRFRDVHPTIELVPSNAIFPKRILKQSNESMEPSSAEQKTDEEERKAKYESVKVSPVKSNLSTTTMIEIKSFSENDNDVRQVEGHQPKGELKLQQLPVLSIKPQTKCEIENIYEIEIKPDEAKSGIFLSKDKNKVIQLVYESSEQEVQQNEIQQNTSNQGQNPVNKFIAPFIEDGHVAETTSGENITTDQTHETSHLSLNLSTSSHLTDDEKFQSDKKVANGTSKEFKHVPKTQAKSVIDNILEVEGMAESSEQTIINREETKIKIQSKVQEQTENFDDLREILRKIRNDKTTLDVALDTIEPPSLMSPARVMTDREVQCDDIDKMATPKCGAVKSPIKYPAKKVASDSSIIESPKFNRTIESIRTSARKLDFSTNYSEYRSATRQQIEKAAKKFLKSILKNADANMPLSASERECSSDIHLKVDKQNYKIVDDQIIQSNYNVKSSRGYCTSSSSSESNSLQLRIPSARIMTNQSRMNNNNRSDSEFTSNSIEKYINNYKLSGKCPQQNLLPNENYNYSDLSDGEILSDGEFHMP